MDSLFDQLLSLRPYSVRPHSLQQLFLDDLNKLSDHHYNNCREYRHIVDEVFDHRNTVNNLSDLPFLPVSLFKRVSLVSSGDTASNMTLSSSGTTGTAKSQVSVDADTSRRQQRAMAHCVGHVLGARRRSMLIIDTETVFSSGSTLSARGAGVLGMMRFGCNYCYALDEDLTLNLNRVKEFLNKVAGDDVFIFGFTYLVWQSLGQLEDIDIDLSKAILIHSGGWKRMTELAVDNSIFRSSLHKKYGLERIHNFYGMVEQLGTLHMEGSDYLLHVPTFSDVLIRDPKTFNVLPDGETGLIQVISLVPRSYPGHSLLTEDLGFVIPSNPASNWSSKALKVIGRVPRAEVRGCGDFGATLS